AALMSRPVLEVADIFRSRGPAWRRANAGHVSLGQLKVMSAIESCRTAALGGHVERCEDCAHPRIAYNSCRNPQPSPHFSHNLERLLERRVLAEIFAISLDKRSQANLGHVGNQIVEHASLPEQRMGSMFGRV